MGMFDKLQCDFKLQEKEIQENEFQTKDLACNLDNLLITKEGRLLLLDDGGNIDLEFHGDLIFYTDTKKSWYEFKARFTEGKLQWIKRINI